MGRPKQWQQVLEVDSYGEQRGNTGVTDLPGDAPALSWQPDTSALAQGIRASLVGCLHCSLGLTLTKPLCSKKNSYKSPVVLFFNATVVYS